MASQQGTITRSCCSRFLRSRSCILLNFEATDATVAFHSHTSRRCACSVLPHASLTAPHLPSLTPNSQRAPLTTAHIPEPTFTILTTPPQTHATNSNLWHPPPPFPIHHCPGGPQYTYHTFARLSKNQNKQSRGCNHRNTYTCTCNSDVLAHFPPAPPSPRAARAGVGRQSWSGSQAWAQNVMA